MYDDKLPVPRGRLTVDIFSHIKLNRLTYVYSTRISIGVGLNRHFGGKVRMLYK